VEVATQQPLFRDDPRGAKVFAVVFAWVMVFVAGWQFYWYWQMRLSIVNDPWARPFEDLCFFFVLSIGLTTTVVLMQVRSAEHVYPLIYITPIVDLVIVQVLIQLGLPVASSILNLLVFLVGVNSVILALAWDEMANRSVSGVSGLWMSIMPVASLILLASAGLCNLLLSWELTGVVLIEWALWPILWVAVSSGLLVLFVMAERRQSLPDERWALPYALLIWTVLTFTIGPLMILLTDFDWMVVLAVVTSGIAQFGVAGAELEALLRHSVGKVAAAIAMAGGYFLALVCVLLPWFVMMPFS
jgi:hypothetical protein